MEKNADPIIRKVAPVVFVCRHSTLLGGQSRIAWELSQQALSENREVHLIARRFPEKRDTHSIHTHRVFQLPGLFSNRWRFRSFANRSSRQSDLLSKKGCLIHGFGDSYRQDILTLGNVDWNYAKHIPGRRPSPSAVFIKKRALLDPGLKFLVLVSKQMKRDVLDLLPDFDESKIRVIYPGVDPSRFLRYSRQEVRNRLHREHGLPLSDVWLVFAAGGDFEKRNRATLAKALLKLNNRPGWKILFVGAHRKEVPWPQELEARTYFLGRLKDVGTVFPGCDLMVYPAWYEEFSLTVLEALASGVPVIVSRCVGASEVISPTNRIVGLLNDPGGVDELAHRIEFFIEEDSLRQKIAAENKEIVPSFHWKAIYEQYRCLYEEVSMTRPLRL